jgi:hypothetical protein
VSMPSGFVRSSHRRSATETPASALPHRAAMTNEHTVRSNHGLSRIISLLSYHFRGPQARAVIAPLLGSSPQIPIFSYFTELAFGYRQLRRDVSVTD